MELFTKLIISAYISINDLIILGGYLVLCNMTSIETSKWSSHNPIWKTIPCKLIKIFFIIIQLKIMIL